MAKQKKASSLACSRSREPVPDQVPAKNAADKALTPNVVEINPTAVEGKLKVIGGSQSDEFNNVLANQAVDALWRGNPDQDYAKQRNATIFGLIGISPKDELEGMMAAQLIAAHNAAMECYRRAMNREQPADFRQANLSQANKLSRTYTTLLDALNRHRGKGQQKVTVEHVHVHAGGQAVVGHVQGVGGGGPVETEIQPHAKQIAHASGPEMRCEDPAREQVPVARDAERPVPNARRKVTRRAEG